MTRPWDSHSRSALGVKKRTLHGAMGPHRRVADVFRSSGTAHKASSDGRTFTAWETGATSGSKPRWYCHDPAIGSCGSPPSLANDTITYDEVGLATSDDGKWWDSVVQVPAAYGYVARPDSDDTGQYFYSSGLSGPNRCYKLLSHLDTTPLFGSSVALPTDTKDPALIMVVNLNAPIEASRFVGPGCTGTWSPSAPPSDLVYYTNAATSQISYVVFTRESPDAPWTLFGGPWDMHAGQAFTVAQTTGLIWGLFGFNAFKVWDSRTSYNTASVTTVTLPAGDVSAWMHWGRVTVVRATTGTHYVYVGTDLVGTLGAPFDPSDFDAVRIGFGWLIVTETTEVVHFYVVTDAGVEYRQTITRDPATMDAFSTVTPADDSSAVSGTTTRFLYDHKTGRWSHRGVMKHVEQRVDAGYAWVGTVHRHVLLRKQRTDVSPTAYYYDLVQVI